MIERATAPQIKNVKIRFVISESSINQLQSSLLYLENESKFLPPYLTYKKTGNYTSLKNNLFYSIWETVGKVNITGIKSIEEIPLALNEFSLIFKINLNEICNIIIDNIFACGSFNRKVDLRALKFLINSIPKTSEENYNFLCDFIPEKFGAAYCRSQKLCIFSGGGKKKSVVCQRIKRGTVVVFGSGKYNILGAKCQRDVANLFHEMNALILKL